MDYDNDDRTGSEIHAHERGQEARRESTPLHSEVLDAFEGLAPSDIVPRSAADPAALAALDAMEGEPIIFRDVDVTEHGIREIETEAYFAGRIGD